MTLKIDGPCSGMNTLFALMFIALLFAHHQQPTLVRRSLLFALSIPLAIIGNMVRIGMLIAGCRLFGQDFAVGNHENEMSSFHLLAGLAVFVVAFIGLQTASSQMNRWLSKRKASPRSGSPATPRDQAPAHPSTLLRSSITLIIAAITAALCTQLPPPTGSQDVGVVMQLPQRVGPLAGIPREPDKIEKERLPTDTSFAKMSYVTANSAPAERDIAQVSVVLAGAESRSIHRPEVCLTGQGWSIDGAKVIPVEISPGRTLFVKDLSISGTFPSNDGKARRQRAHYVYWFAGHGVTTPSHFERLWRSTWDAVLHNVNHRWAYAAVMAHVTENFDPEECGERRRTDEQTERLITFLIQNLVPQFQKDFFVEGKPAIVN